LAPSPIELIINLQPEAISKSNIGRVEYEIKNLQENDQVSCTLNNTSLDNCDSPLVLNDLATGEHKLELLINNGNCPNFLATINWTVEIPEVPVPTTSGGPSGKLCRDKCRSSRGSVKQETF